MTDEKVITNHNRLAGIVVMAVSAAMVILFLLPVRYICYSADDFGFMGLSQSVIDQNPGLSVIRVELHNAKYYYLGWQGTYTENVIVFFLMQLQHLGIHAFQALCAADIILFLSGVFFFIKATVSSGNASSGILLSGILFLLIVAAGFSYTTPDEVFYWIDGSIAYAIPFGVGMFGIGEYERFLITGKKRHAFLSAVLGFIGCGGKLVLAAFLNAVYLFLMLNYIHDEKVKRNSVRKSMAASWKSGTVIPFLTVFAGALVNSLAPGNFIRHNTEDPRGFIPGVMLGNTLQYTLREYRNMFISGYLPAVCAAVVLIVLMTSLVSIKTSVHPFWIILYAFFTVYISIFPYAAGYSEFDNFLSNRVALTIDVFIAITTVYAVLYLVQWLKYRFWHLHAAFPYRKFLLSTGITAVFLINIFIVGNAAVFPSLIRELADGTMKAHYQISMEILNEIAESPEQDVIIVKHVPESLILKDIDITDNPDYWANEGVAGFYGKDSIVLIDSERE